MTRAKKAVLSLVEDTVVGNSQINLELFEKIISHDPVLKGNPVRLYRSHDGKDFVELVGKGMKKHGLMILSSKAFKKTLNYYHLSNNPLSSMDAIEKDVNEAIKKLDAIFEGEVNPQHIFNRIANLGDTIFVNLNNDAKEVVKITGDGWETITECPVLFIPSNNALEMPKPETGGSLEDLTELFNVDDDSAKLIAASILMMFRGMGPYPVLNLIGPQGSTKSTTATIIRNLVDPVRHPLLQIPKSVHDLNVVAAKNAILNLNNVSKLSDAISDALCVIATEGGAANRKLFTSDDVVVLENNRPIIINGITRAINRGDLIDRTISIHLPKVSKEDRKTRKKVMDEFERRHSRILGMLFDGVAAGLKYFDTMEPNGLPRMADFAQFICAAAKGMNGKMDSFLEIYNNNQEEALNDTLENSVTVQAINNLMISKKSWTGPMWKLLSELKVHHNNCMGALPDNAQTLRNEIRRVEHLLTIENITIEQLPRKSGERPYIITKTII